MYHLLYFRNLQGDRFNTSLSLCGNVFRLVQLHSNQGSGNCETNFGRTMGWKTINIVPGIHRVVESRLSSR
jgi:hypothetical protein